MRPIHRLQRLTCMAALMLSLMLACSAVVASPAHANARHSASAGANGSSLDLSLNGTSFQYDDSYTFPKFTAVLTLAAPLPQNDTLTALVNFDNGQALALPNQFVSSDRLTVSFYPYNGGYTTTGASIAIGARTAMATVTDTTAGTITTSNQIAFTITKISLGLTCGAATVSGGTQIKVGQPITVGLNATHIDPNVPFAWTDGTATVSFVGPGAVTYQNLQPDSNGNMTVTAPSVLGSYEITCSFSGTPYYAAGQASSGSNYYTVSDMSALGGVRLYTNPTTLTPNHATQMYIVFQPASGLPTPTGQFNITVGVSTVYYTNSISISSRGAAAITFGPIPNLGGATKIDVHYFGDTHYADQIITFPLTNPAIPSGAGGSGGGGSPAQPKATSTIASSATASATTPGGAMPSATATPGGGQVALSATASPLGGALGWLLAALVALLVVGGGIGGVVFWRSRRRAAAVPTSPASSAWSARSPLEEDTRPHRTPDRW